MKRPTLRFLKIYRTSSLFSLYSMVFLFVTHIQFIFKYTGKNEQYWSMKSYQSIIEDAMLHLL